MKYKIKGYESTHFGASDLVVNVPAPTYNFEQHTSHLFTNFIMRFPHFAQTITVDADWDDTFSYIDYILVLDETDHIQGYYFVSSVVPQRNSIIFSVSLDVISSYHVLESEISGILTRKHDTNLLETPFDYPTALNVEGNYTTESYEFVGYSGTPVRFIESSVNLSTLGNAVTVNSATGAVTVPTLLKPTHVTQYDLGTWASGILSDISRAFTLYLNDSIDTSILNTVRGLSGDGAISDSYAIPSDAITVTATGAEVTNLHGNYVEKITSTPMTLNFLQGRPSGEIAYEPMNEALKGMFRIRITSSQEKNNIDFPAWAIKNSIDDDNNFEVILWNDCKPSGTPFCCPTQVETLEPVGTSETTKLSAMESKSCRGGQWLRSPLLYTTASGEIFATIQTQLERERAAFENKQATFQLELNKKEREVNIAKQNYEFQMAQATNAVNGISEVGQGNVMGAIGTGINAINTQANQKFVEDMRAVQNYEQTMQKQLISISYSNNLKNLNVQETLRRIVAPSIVYQSNESLGSYTNYNGFFITKVQPDLDTLKAKDIEYSKYGYPVYQSVQGFVMTDYLRENHTVYQFQSPTVEMGGIVGEMIIQTLTAGIRIASKKITPDNLLNNPKVV